MIGEIIYYIIETVVLIILIMDIIVAVTVNVRNAGKFIRRMRFIVYSITPAMYCIMVLAVWVITGILGVIMYLRIIATLLIAVSCCITYAGRFFALKKSDKKRISAKKIRLCDESTYTQLQKKKG